MMTESQIVLLPPPPPPNNTKEIYGSERPNPPCEK